MDPSSVDVTVAPQGDYKSQGKVELCHPFGRPNFKLMNRRMRKLGVIVLVSLFAIFAVGDIVRDFIANDTVHY